MHISKRCSCYFYVWFSIPLIALDQRELTAHTLSSKCKIISVGEIAKHQYRPTEQHTHSCHISIMARLTYLLIWLAFCKFLMMVLPLPGCWKVIAAQLILSNQLETLIQ